MSIFELMTREGPAPRRQIGIVQVSNGWMLTNEKMETFISRDAEGIVEILAKEIDAKVDVVREVEK